MPDSSIEENYIITHDDKTIKNYHSQVIEFNYLLHLHTYSCKSPCKLKRKLE